MALLFDQSPAFLGRVDDDRKDGILHFYVRLLLICLDFCLDRTTYLGIVDARLDILEFTGNTVRLMRKLRRVVQSLRELRQVVIYCGLYLVLDARQSLSDFGEVAAMLAFRKRGKMILTRAIRRHANFWPAARLMGELRQG